MTRRPWTRAALVLPAAAVVLAGAGGTAYAVAQARATATQPIAAVASFGAQAQPNAGTPPQSGPLVLRYVDNNDRAARTFMVRNTGTLNQTAQSWEVTVVNTSGGTKGSATITTCRSTFTLAGLCSNLLEQPVTVATVNDAGTTPVNRFTTSIALAPSAVFYVRFAPDGIRGYDATFTLTVSRAQTTPGARTSSS